MEALNTSVRQELRSDTAVPAPEDDLRTGFSFQNRNFCLLIFLIVGVLTVACACVAVVSAVVGHFWESMENMDVSSGNTIPRHSAQVFLQKISDEDQKRSVFCFINQSNPSGSPVRFSVENLSTSFCDAIVHVSVGLDTSKESLRYKGRAVDAEADKLRRFVQLKTPESHLTTWVCAGGEAKDSNGFAALIRSKRTRLSFIRNSVAWLRQMGLDGLVLYWRYPGLDVRSNFSILISTMQALFEKEGLNLSVVVPWNLVTRRHGYFEHTLYNRLDVVIVDTHRTIDPASFPVTTCQSPINSVFRARHHGQVGLASVLDDLSMVTEHLLRKTMLSVSFAGVSFNVKRPWVQHHVGMASAGRGRPMAYTRRSGVASYYEVW